MPMLLAARARTSLSIAGALAALLTAAAFVPAGDDAAGSDNKVRRIQEIADGVVVEAQLVSPHVKPGSVVDLAVTITVPERDAPVQRAVAIVLDRSGSMLGEPLADAKRAAHRLVDQLRFNDQLSISTYSDDGETVVPLNYASDATKRSAHDAIDAIVADGGTCISCGIQRGQDQLDRAMFGVRRMILISDGQASMGLRDRDELVGYARFRSYLAPITSIGVGLDFDEATMKRIAEATAGNYYVAEQAAALGDIFARELVDLDGVVGSAVHLVFSSPRGRMTQDRDGSTPFRDDFETDCFGNRRSSIQLADLRSGETRTLTVRVTVPADADGELVLANVNLMWMSGAAAESRRSSDTAIVTTR